MTNAFARGALCAFLALSWCAAPARAAGGEPLPPPPRPRVGLALGGGSARGLAHIGVLQWLDEHRIPVDLVAGTSAGALVGGGFALGMSPAELRALMRRADWDAMFQADSPFRHKLFRRKQDRRAFPTVLEFGLRHGFMLPGGLNPGQQVMLLLDRMALAYADLESFDELPTPFRCVATDLRTADSVVLGRGVLATALRATMALPGVFTPVEYGDWLLVDGGTLNNVPGDVARAMGADVVIAVNLGPVRTGARADQSLIRHFGRTIDTMMAAGVRKALSGVDLVITPELPGLDGMSWRRSDELADLGYQAAARHRDILLTYSVSEREYSAYLAERGARRRTALPVPVSVTVAGVPEAEAASIREQLAGHVGVPVDPDRIEADILSIAGTDRYEYLTYRVTEETGRPCLAVTVRPKSYGPPFLAMGLELNNIDANNFAATVAARTTLYDLAGPGSELRLDVALGTQVLAGGELYQPLGRGPLFGAARASYTRGPANYFEDQRLIAQYSRKRAGAGFDLGLGLVREAELRVGFDVADVHGRLAVGSPVRADVRGWERFGSVRFTHDGQDSPVVPSSGLLLHAELRRYFDAPTPAAPAAGEPVVPTRFWRGEVTGSVFRRVHRADRVFAAFGTGTAFGELPLWGAFSLGGPLRLGAFANDEMRGANYVLGAAGYLRRVARLPDLVGGNVYAGTWLEAGSAFDRRADAAWHGNVSTGAVLETLLGPVFVGGSVGSGWRGRFYVAIGKFF
ncbi:MAG TPA: patatin-like phospholipase family protein [Vicinamibacterales bacterium]|nr:patatin-like phospholipase family protein [Vicinamibacterales bacterium]